MLQAHDPILIVYLNVILNTIFEAKVFCIHMYLLGALTMEINIRNTNLYKG